MFSSLKRWVKNDESVHEKQPPSGMQTMCSDLQKKFAKGVQYNLKIVIRGDRNTGKTCLWHRLQGHKFIEAYVPTPEIQAASIQWSYKATDDIVKVDVWDVVDQGKPKHYKDVLKKSHNATEGSHMLDANFLDVYKGAHAVLILFDITKKWTYQYAERELPKVPAHIPVLIMANFRDMGDHRVVTLEEIEILVKTVDRPPGSASVFFLESSMKSGFGLKYINKFFNLPFLILQRESLLKQLETNHLDVESCLEELHFEACFNQQNYDTYAKLFQEKLDRKTKAKTSDSRKQDTAEAIQASSNNAAGETLENVPPSSLDIISSANHKEKLKSDVGFDSPSTLPSSATSTQTEQSEKKGFVSRLFKGTSSATLESAKVTETKTAIPPALTITSSGSGPVSIDEFVPDEADADNFLNDIPDASVDKSDRIDPESSSSSDDEDDNPMVAGFQEELDSDDQVPTETRKVYTYSDSDDDYVTTPKAKPASKPVSTRSHPRSRINLPTEEEKSKLQLMMDSSVSSTEIDDELPSEEIDYEAKSASDGEHVVENDHSSSISIPVIDENIERNITRKAEVKTTNYSNTKSEREEERNLSAHAESSSEEDDANQMVSTTVEDISSGEGSHKNVSTPTKKQACVEEQTADRLQLQSSDLDFLEKISTTSPAQEPSPPKRTSPKSKHKSKSNRKKDSERGDETRTRKHKKKKKSKTSADAGDETKNKKKQSKEDEDLEAFLEGEVYKSS